MKKELKGFILGVILTTCIGVAADNWKSIDVQSNLINVMVNGKKITADNFLYNDTTYLPMRAIGEALGQKVSYDEATSTAYIGEKGNHSVSAETTANKHTPPEDVLNDKDNDYIVKDKDGIYYATVKYADKFLYAKGYKCQGFSEDTKEAKWAKDNEQPIVIKFDLKVYERAVVTYDYFVENILPLIQQD